MSRLWPERVSIVLCPDRLVVATRPPRLRSGEPAITIVPVPDAPAKGGWEAALQRLDTLAAATAESWQNTTVRLILSNHFVRYALVPWNDELGNEAEQRQFARQHFATIYGPVAKSWAVRLSLDVPGRSHVASAVDQALVDRLNDLTRSYRLKLKGLEPLLMTAFNRWQPKLVDDVQWFVVIEPGMACGALVGRSRWFALRRWPIQCDWTSEVPLWLGREQLIDETSASVGPVYLLAPSQAGPEVPVVEGTTLLLGDEQDKTASGGVRAHVCPVEEAGHFSCIL